MCVKRVHGITEVGKKCRPVTGFDYIDEKGYLSDSEIYDDNKHKVIVVSS